MNRRQTKKALKQALQAVVPKADTMDELIRDCASLAYQITNNTDFNVWFEHTAHVKWVEVRVTHKSDDYDWLAETKITYYSDQQYVIDRMKELRANLQYILDHGKLPYSSMHRETVESYEYRLA